MCMLFSPLLKLSSYIDVQVYFHAKDQFLDLSGRLGNKVYIGKRYETQIVAQVAPTLLTTERARWDVVRG